MQINIQKMIRICNLTYIKNDQNMQINIHKSNMELKMVNQS